MLAKITAIMLYMHLNNEDLFNRLLIGITIKHHLPENGLIVFFQRILSPSENKVLRQTLLTTSIGNLIRIMS